MTEVSLLAWLDGFGYSIVWILASIVWQSSIVLAVSLAVSFALRKWNPSLRHTLLASAILLIPLLPFLGKAYDRIGSPKIILHILPPHSLHERDLSVNQLEMTTAEAISDGRTTAEPVATADISAQNEKIASEAESISNSSSLLSIFSILKSYPWAILFILYISGAAAFLLIIIIGRLRLEYLYRNCTPVTDKNVLSIFRNARDKIGMDRDFLIVESDDTSAPMTAGTSHPVILIPYGLIETLSDDELHAIALHELSHVKRNDPLILTVVSVVRAILFFHPLIWIASRKISLLAEHACDDAVINNTKKPLFYARLLTRIAESVPKWAFRAELANGIVINKSVFLRRVEAILSDRREQIRRFSRMALSSSALAFLLSVVVAVAVPLSVTQNPFIGNASLAGNVYFDKMPIANADLYIVSTDGFTRYDVDKAGKSAKDGSFRIPYKKTLHDTYIYLVCSSRDGLFGWQQLDGSSRKNVHMILDSTRSLTGKITDHNGTAVPAASVYINYIQYSGENSLIDNRINILGNFPDMTTTTDANGEFTLTSLPQESTATIVVSAADYGQKMIYGMNSATDNMTVTLEPEGSISGSIDLSQVDIKAEELTVVAYPSGSYGNNQAFVSAEVKPDGTFKIGKLGEDSYTLLVEGLLTTESKVFIPTSPIDVATGENKDGIYIAPATCTSVTGTVSMKDTGDPIAGMPVTIKTNAMSRPIFMTESASDGSYTISVPPGVSEIVIFPPDSCAVQYVSKPIMSNSSEPLDDINFTIERGITLNGTVHTEEGEAIAGALVSSGFMGNNKSWSDNEGKFMLKGLKRGETIGVYSTERAGRLKTSLKFDVEDNRHVGLVLSPYRTTRCSGRVTDEHGNPKPGINIDLSNSDEKTGSGRGTIGAVSGKNGEFVIAELIIGCKYTMQVNMRASIRKQIIAEKYMNPVTLVLSTDNIKLDGIVSDLDGNPVQGAHIYTRDSKSGFKTTQSGKDGSFSFDDLASLAENLHIQHTSYGRYSHEFTLTGRSHEFTVIRSDKSISGIITDADGNPSDKAKLNVSQSEMEKKLEKMNHTIYTDKNGKFSINDLSYDEVDEGLKTDREDVVLKLDKVTKTLPVPVSIAETPYMMPQLDSSQTIEIDGSLDDWQVLNAEKEDIVFYDPSVASGLAPATDRDDLSAEFSCSTDNEYVYLAVSITDDDIRHYNTSKSAAWGNETIELLFDGEENDEIDGVFQPSSKIWVSFYDDNTVRLAGRDPISRDDYPNLWTSLGVKAAVETRPYGRDVEIAIPWEILYWSGWEKDSTNRMNIRLFDKDENEDNTKCIEWAAHPDENYGWIDIPESGQSSSSVNRSLRDIELTSKLYAILNSINNKKWEVGESILGTLENRELSIVMLAVMYKKAKDDEAYLETLKAIFNLHDRSRETDCWLLKAAYREARFYLLRGRYDEALSLLIPASEIPHLNADHFSARFNLGFSYFLLERFAEAKEAIEDISVEELHQYLPDDHDLFKRREQLLTSIRQLQDHR